MTAPEGPARRALGTVRQARGSSEARAELLERVRRHGRITRLFSDLYRRDNDPHGAIFAAAVAFRLFLWMLPFTLVIVAGLGFIRESGADPEAALRLSLIHI